MLFKDQLGCLVELNSRPQKVVSIVPSQTELLAYLGLDDEVIGITKFCTQPDYWHEHKILVGGTKTLKIEIIKSLQPDLIIGNKEENDLAQIEMLQSLFPVWMSDISNLEDALDMILSVGNIFDRKKQSAELINKIEVEFKSIHTNLEHLSVLYLIWKKPFMAAGKNTFINSMLNKCGWINTVESNRYPELSLTDIQDLNPDLVLLSSEPYPFNKKHRSHILGLLPNAQVYLVDGTYFSWYGSRLKDAAQYFNNFIHALQAE